MQGVPGVARMTGHCAEGSKPCLIHILELVDCVTIERGRLNPHQALHVTEHLVRVLLHVCDQVAHAGPVLCLSHRNRRDSSWCQQPKLWPLCMIMSGTPPRPSDNPSSPWGSAACYSYPRNPEATRAGISSLQSSETSTRGRLAPAAPTAGSRRQNSVSLLQRTTSARPVALFHCFAISAWQRSPWPGRS